MKKLYIIFLVSIPFLSVTMTKEKEKKQYQVPSLYSLTFKAATKNISEEITQIPTDLNSALELLKEVDRVVPEFQTKGHLFDCIIRINKPLQECFRHIKRSISQENIDTIYDNLKKNPSLKEVFTKYLSVWYISPLKKVGLLLGEKTPQMINKPNGYIVNEGFKWYTEKGLLDESSTIRNISFSPNEDIIAILEKDSGEYSIKFKLENRSKQGCSSITIPLPGYIRNYDYQLTWQSNTHLLVNTKTWLQVYKPDFQSKKVAELSGKLWLRDREALSLSISPNKKTLAILFSELEEGAKHIQFYNWNSSARKGFSSSTGNWEKLKENYPVDERYSNLIFLPNGKELILIKRFRCFRISIDTYSLSSFKKKRSFSIPGNVDKNLSLHICPNQPLLAIQEGEAYPKIYNFQLNKREKAFEKLLFMNETTVAILDQPYESRVHLQPQNKILIRTHLLPKTLEQALLISLLDKIQGRVRYRMRSNFFESPKQIRSELLKAITESLVYKALDQECPISKAIKTEIEQLKNVEQFDSF